jgi:hypothetical protein
MVGRTLGRLADSVSIVSPLKQPNVTAHEHILPERVTRRKTAKKNEFPTVQSQGRFHTAGSLLQIFLDWTCPLFRLIFLDFTEVIAPSC